MKNLFTLFIFMLACQFSQAQFDCQNATLLSCGQAITDNNAIGCKNFVVGGYCGTNYNLYTASEKVYKFTVAATQNVNIRLSGLTADLDMFLLRSCWASDCIAKSDQPPTYNYESISANLAPGNYYFVVDGWSGATCSYQIALNCNISSGQPDCATASPLTCNQTITSSTEDGKNNTVGPYCNNYCNYAGKEKVYYVNITNRSTVSFTANGFTGDLDMFLLNSCNRNACVAFSGKSSTNTETIQAILDPGKYYLVLDGYEGAVSPYNLSYTCQAQSAPLDCNTAIQINYSGSGSDLKFNYVFSAGPEYQFKQWRYNNTILATVPNVNLAFQAGGTYNICADYVNTVTGQIGTCCKKSCISLPVSCEDVIQYQFVNGVFKLSIAGNTANYQNISWRNDTDGVTINPDNVPPSCRNLVMTVRYYDTSTACWVLCCRNINFCAPTSCQDQINYVYNGATNSFNFTFAHPSATNLIWKFDDTNTLIPNGVFTLPQGWTCAEKTVSVYYYDTVTKCWKVCCRKITICPPANCDKAINYAYIAAGNKYQFTLDVPGASNVTWKFDDDNSVIPDGYFALPQGWVCKDRVVSAFYFNPTTQCWNICSKKVTICPPSNCESAINYTYLGSTNQFKFTLNIPNIQDIVWKFDEDGTVIPNGVFTIPTGWVCKEKIVSAYYFDPSTQCWKVCCKKITICPPTSCESSIQYKYDLLTDKYTFEITIPGVQNPIWKFDDTGEVLPNGTFTVPSGWTCTDRVVSVYYFNPATQCWSVCCKKINICPPLNCQESIKYSYSPDGNTLQLTFNGAAGIQHLQWLDASTGQPMGTSGSVTVTVPVTTTCAAKTFSVTYLENGVWKMCCKRIYVCNPNHCSNTINQSNTSSQVTVNVAQSYTHVEWYNKTSGASLGTGVQIQLPLTNGTINMPVVVSYYDPVAKYFISCAKDVIVTCTLPVASFTYAQAGAGINFTNTSTGSTTYEWNFGGGTPAAGSTINTANPVAVYSSGTYEVCLKATNNCGTHSICKSITINTGYDCTFSISKDVCGQAGQEVLIPVKVAKFNNVLTFNFTIKCSDPSKLSFISLEKYNSTIENGSNHYIQPDHLRFFWSQAGAKSLPDNSDLFFIKCKFSSSATTPVTLYFTDDPVKSEAYSGDLQKLKLELVNGSACINTSPLGYDIAGQIRTQVGDKPISAAEVRLSGDSTTTHMTASDGNFTFNDVKAGNTILVKPFKNTDHLNGVNALDIVRLQRHLLQIDPLATPYKMIAADVNNDKVVNALDVVVLQRMQLRLIDQFPNNTSWRFIPVGYEFGSQPPLDQQFPEQIQYSSLSTDQMHTDFYGVKVGDLDDSNVSTARNEQTTLRTLADTVKMKIGSAYALKNDYITVPVKTKDFKRLSAFEGTIKWDSTKLKFDGVTNFGLPGLSLENFARPNQGSHNVLTFNWIDGSINGVSLEDDKTVFALRFKVLVSAGEKARIEWVNDPLPLFAANADLKPIGIQLNNADISIINPLTTDVQVKHISCANLNNGSINVAVNGGTGNNQIQWKGLSTTSLKLENLPKGTYTGIVSDTLAAMQSTVNVTINSPEELKYAATTSFNPESNTYNISCNVTGGVAPYQYSWSTGATTRDIKVESSGTYSVVIVDNNLCSIKGTTEVVESVSAVDSEWLAKWRIYPNPASEYIVINNLDRLFGEGNLEIHNIAGQMVHKAVISNDAKIDVSSFIPGLYTATIQANKTTGKFKFVVIR